MTARPTYRECLALNLSVNETAKRCNVTPSAVTQWAKKNKVKFRDERKDEAHRERARKQNADPEFTAYRIKKLKEYHANVAKNPMYKLTETEREDYVTYKRAGYNQKDALIAIGRKDLIKAR